MIATHSIKMFNARLKVKAIASKIIGDIPDYLICSRTTDIRKNLWAAPNNAAEMRKWRDVIANLPADFDFESSLPGLTDPQLKQILVPADWRNDSYVSVTPAPSMGLINELNLRIKELELPCKFWTIQPIPAAMANHGECLMMLAGKLRLLRRGPLMSKQGKWTGDFIQLTARCEGMNISSGMIATGFPAITAIGGFIHSLERKINHDIKFALGVRNSNWIQGIQKIAATKSSVGITTGRVQGKTVTPSPAYSPEEITANAEIVLLLKTEGDQKSLVDILLNTNRIAGGRLFDLSVSVIKNDLPPNVSYLIDASADITRKRKCENVDSLGAALAMYGEDGKFIDGRWQQPRNDYTLNHTGYAFLESPQERAGARSDLHAWAEPTFSLITQGSMTDLAWWSRYENNSGVFWKG